MLVDKWVTDTSFGGRGEEHPTDIVPKALYLEDGRSVPVCVVKVDRVPCDETASISQLRWPDHVIGGGYPLVIDSQGERHVASVGCLVTDGHTRYSITSRHVAGKPGDVIQTLWHGKPVRIGVSSDRQLTRKPFTEVYPEFVSRKTFSISMSLSSSSTMHASGPPKSPESVRSATSKTSTSASSRST